MTVKISGSVNTGFTTGGLFDRARFEKLLEAHGLNVKWEKAIICPFRKGPSPRDHDINCRQCNEGFIYYDAVTTRMLVQSLGLSENYYAYGRFDTGRATITALPEFKVSFWDRVTLTDSRVRYTELVYRQPSTLRDKPRHPPLEVTYVVWANRDGTQTTYTEGVEFTIDTATGELVWAGATRPDDGTVYAVSYYHRPEYIVIDLVHHIRDMREPDGTTIKEYPVQVIGQFHYNGDDESRDAVHEDLRARNPFPDSSKAGWPSD